MSPQFWFEFWEVWAAIGTLLVIVGLLIEYGLEIFTFLRFWEKNSVIEFHIKVESPREQKGSALVVFGIAIELLGAVGIFVQSSRIDIQHKAEIARLSAALMRQFLSNEDQREIASQLSTCSKDAAILVDASKGSGEALGKEIFATLKLAHLNAHFSPSDRPSYGIAVGVTEGSMWIGVALVQAFGKKLSPIEIKPVGGQSKALFVQIRVGETHQADLPIPSEAKSP